jgi:hypothetical protein
MASAFAPGSVGRKTTNNLLEKIIISGKRAVKINKNQ